jgi:NADPH2:quinone reductase
VQYKGSCKIAASFKIAVQDIKGPYRNKVSYKPLGKSRTAHLHWPRLNHEERNNVKAIVCKEYGPPESLLIEDIQPPQLEPNQVRIAVKACGVNFPDFLIIAGNYQVKPPLPFTPGAELSGEIIETGSDVNHLLAGQRVLAMTQFGCMAEEVCVNAAAVMPIPDSMEYETAAGFMLTYGTAYHALKQRGHLQANETLLVLGAAGGVGLAAVELGAAMGAKVIAAASSDEKLALAKEFGAAHVINYAENRIKDAVKEFSRGRGVDVILDPVGGDLFDDCLRAVAWNGRILVIGFAGGKIQSIPANLPLLKGSSIIGVFWGRFTEEQPAEHLANTKELLAMFVAGELRPHISRTFPLEEASAAIRCLADRSALGKVIVTI